MTVIADIRYIINVFMLNTSSLLISACRESELPCLQIWSAAQPVALNQLDTILRGDLLMTY